MARSIGDVVADVVTRAHRVALLSEFIETLPRDIDRKRVVMSLYEARIISADTTDLLFEKFGLMSA